MVASSTVASTFMTILGLSAGSAGDGKSTAADTAESAPVPFVRVTTVNTLGDEKSFRVIMNHEENPLTHKGQYAGSFAGTTSDGKPLTCYVNVRELPKSSILVYSHDDGSVLVNSLDPSTGQLIRVATTLDELNKEATQSDHLWGLLIRTPSACVTPNCSIGLTCVPGEQDNKTPGTQQAPDDKAETGKTAGEDGDDGEKEEL